MPVYKSGDKWKIGKHGKPRFKSKDAAEKAFKHWIDTKESEEMVKKHTLDEKFELTSEKHKAKKEKVANASEIKRLMKMAGIEKKLEKTKEGDVDFDGMFTGVASGEIQVDENRNDDTLNNKIKKMSTTQLQKLVDSMEDEQVSGVAAQQYRAARQELNRRKGTNEDIEMFQRLAGLTEKKVKRSIFSRDQEHDRFSLFKEFKNSKLVQEDHNPAHDAAQEYLQRMNKGQYDQNSLLAIIAKKYFDPSLGGDIESFKDAIMASLHSMDEGEVIQGPWGQGGSKDPQVRNPQKPELPDDAAIMDKYYELYDPKAMGYDYDDVTAEIADWLQDEYGVPVDNALNMIDNAYEAARKNQEKNPSVPYFLDDTDLDINLAKEDTISEEKARPDLIAYAKKLGLEVSNNITTRELNSLVLTVLKKKYEKMSGKKIPQGTSATEIRKLIRDLTLDEKAPKGWEGTVKAMKDEPEIDNPYALANWMKKKGYKSHKKEGIQENNPNQSTFQLIYPEKRIVSANKIWSWYNDALADGEVEEVNPNDIKAAIAQLEDIGKITIGRFKESIDDRHHEYEAKLGSEENMDETPYDEGVTARRRGDAMLDNPYVSNDPEKEWWDQGWRDEDHTLRTGEERVSNTYYLGGEGIQKIWNKIKDAENDLGPLGIQRLDLILDNFPISIDDARKVLDKIKELEQHNESTGKSEDEIWENFMKNHKKSKLFTEGSYSRLAIELIVEEMKKGKTSEQISEELSFNPEEVFYVVEFFTKKKVKETKKEDSDEETTKENIEESADNKNLKRLRYLAEYKNTR